MSGKASTGCHICQPSIYVSVDELVSLISGDNRPLRVTSALLVEDELLVLQASKGHLRMHATQQ